MCLGALLFPLNPLVMKAFGFCYKNTHTHIRHTHIFLFNSLSTHPDPVLYQLTSQLYLCISVCAPHKHKNACAHFSDTWQIFLFSVEWIKPYYQMFICICVCVHKQMHLWPSPLITTPLINSFCGRTWPSDTPHRVPLQKSQTSMERLNPHLTLYAHTHLHKPSKTKWNTSLIPCFWIIATQTPFLRNKANLFISSLLHHSFTLSSKPGLVFLFLAC